MCPAALSSLHVRARMGCASDASSASALACTQQLVAFQRKGKETQRREIPRTLTKPQLGPCGEDSSLDLPSKMCPKRENISAFLCELVFPQERYRGGCWTVWKHVSTCKGQDQDSAATTQVMGKSTLPKHTWHSGGSATSFLRGLYPRKNFIFEAWHDPTNQPPGEYGSPLLYPHW